MPFGLSQFGNNKYLDVSFYNIDNDSDKIFNHINKLNKKNIVCYKRDKKYIELEKSKKKQDLYIQ